MNSASILTLVAIVLLIVGGINWGLVGVANFDLVAFIFGNGSILARIVYSLVGLSAVGVALRLPAIAKGQ